MTAIKRHTNREIFDFFRSRLTGLSMESACKYRRTISEFDCFLAGHSLSVQELSTTMMGDWATELLRQGLSESTVIRHLNIVNSLVRSAAQKGFMLPNDAPRTIAKALENTADGDPFLLDERCFTDCLQRLRSLAKGTESACIYGDILLISLLEGGRSLNDIIFIKKEDGSGYDALSRAIIERNISPKREYVFDLRQSRMTAGQLRAVVYSGVLQLFREIIPLSISIDPEAFVRSLWVSCMIRGGATASEALYQAGGTAPYAVPSFCIPGREHGSNSQSWKAAVSPMLGQEMPRWYAMHMRRKVSYEELAGAISERIRPVPELFYPVETIRKRIGDKMTVDKQPFISHTVFFRSNPEKVKSMFGIIGDKAWCYRVSNSPGSPYAVISDEDMRRFQGAIGVFTPDIEIHRLGELTPKPGETVIIIKAGYGNRTGTVREVISKKCGSTIFRVELSTEHGYEWREEFDARQIERTHINQT